MPTIHVEKSAQIQAPLQQVYDHLRDFKQWPEWSPWLITDPDCHLTYADDGSAYSWEGKVWGAGEMTVVGETSPHRIDSELTFFKPWKSHADVRLQLSERNGTTTVIWSMDSTLPFFLFWMKAMMIAFIGMDYQRGLAMLKDKLETGSVPSHLEFLGQRSQPGFAFVGKRTSCPITEMSVKMEADFDQLRKWLEKEGLTPTNHFLSVYHRWDIVKGVVDYTAAAPIARTAATVSSSGLPGPTPTRVSPAAASSPGNSAEDTTGLLLLPF